MAIAVVVWHDVTAQGEPEGQYIDVLAFVGHELRAPLGIISGYTQLVLRWLQQRADEVDLVREARALQIVDVQTRRLGALLNDLLDASRVDAGLLRLNPVATPLADFLRGLVERLGVLSSKHRLTFVALSERDLPVPVDQMRLEQVVTNLITNAVKYSPGGGPVEVTLQTSGERAVITVRDEGIGIAPSDLPRVFERHYRSVGQMAEVDGMGLGLYVTRKLVEAHGGQILVESAEGVGTTICFWLPLAGPPGIQGGVSAPGQSELVGF